MVTLVFWLSSVFLLLLLLFLHFKEHLSVYICVLYAGEGGRGREDHLFCCLYSHENNWSRGSRTTSSAGHTESVYETSLHALEVSLALSGFFPLLQIIVISKPNLFKLGKDTSPQVCQLQTRAQNVLRIFFQLLEYASVTTMVLWQTLFSCCREC